jgi:thymidylate kinase
MNGEVERRWSSRALGIDVSLILEFVGLSGAGKTTVAEALLHRLREQGYTCAYRHDIGGQGVPRIRHFSRLAAHFIRHPGLFSASVHLSRAAPGLTRSRFREAIRFYVWSYRLAIGRRLGPDILILDQGIIQEGWGLVVRETGLPAPAILAATKNLIAGARVRYALVYLDVDRGLAARRIAGRSTGESRFDTMNQVDARRLLESSEPLLQEMHSSVVNELRLAELRIDGSRTIEELVEELVDFIRKLPARSPAGTFVSH